MGRNRLKDQQTRDLRRKQILSNALAHFARNGLAETTITDIASASGISHGLLYHYFSSKEELYIALIKIAFEKLNTACRDLENLPVSPREKIIMALEALLKGLSEQTDTAKYHVLIAQASISDATPEEAKEILRSSRDLPYTVLTRIMREGQANGSIITQDPKMLAMIFWATVKGLALHKAVYGDAYIPPDSEILGRMFLRDI